MSQPLDYVAFDWVATELEDTIKQAHQALEAYSQDRNDFSKLRFTLTHTHQINGTLRMVQLDNLVELAEEAEAVSQALVNNATPDEDAALEILMTALLQLPGLLARVRKVKSDISPAALQPIISRLRSVRGAEISSPNKMIDFSAAFSSRVSSTDFDELMSKLRKMFRVAVLNIARSTDVEKNVRYLAQIGQRIHKISQNTNQEAFWRMALALFEALEEESLPIGNQVAKLLLELDKLLIDIASTGSDALKEPAPEAVHSSIKGLLRSVNSKRPTIIELQSEWDEQSQSPAQLETLGPDSDTLKSVVDALLEELASIKDYIDLFVRNRDRADVQLEPTLPVFEKIINTMMVLGLGNTLRVVRELSSTVTQMVEGKIDTDDGSLSLVAEKIIGVEAHLRATVQQEDISSEIEITEQERQFDHAFTAVIAESRRNIDQAKELIIEFIAHQWDHECLQRLPGLLQETRGSLALLSLQRAESVLGCCERYVCDHLLEGKQVPEWQKLDTLADALSGVDFYLEHLRDGGNASSNDAVLDSAVQSVAELGFPVEELSAWERRPELYVSADEEDDDLEITDFIKLDDNFDEAAAEELQQEVRQAEGRRASYTATAALATTAVVAANSDSDQSESIEDQDTDASDVDLSANTAESVAQLDGNGTEAPDAKEAAFEPEIDAEIVEIFIEEVDEVLEELDEHLPATDNEESLAVVRRSFHTLKGSGRMVGASEAGELAWGVENMLNRVVDGTQSLTPAHTELIGQARALIPVLVEDFKAAEHQGSAESARLCALADAISTGQSDINTAEQIGCAEAPTTANDSSLPEIPVGVAGNDDGAELVGQADTADEALSSDDEEMLRVFAAESDGNLQVIDDFAADCSRAGELDASEELHRALHTLKGSARIAGFESIGDYVAPVENYVLELLQLRRSVDSEAAGLLSGLTTLVRSDLSLLPNHTDENNAEAERLLATARELSSKLDAKEDDLEALDIEDYLAQTMDDVSNAGTLLHDIKAGHSEQDALLRMARLYETIAERSELCRQDAIHSLTEAGCSALEQSATLSTLPNSLKDLLDLGQEGLATALDALVSGQNIVDQKDYQLALKEFEQFDLDSFENKKVAGSTTSGAQSEKLIAGWMDGADEVASPTTMAGKFFQSEQNSTGAASTEDEPAVTKHGEQEAAKESQTANETPVAVMANSSAAESENTAAIVSEDEIDPVDQEILEIFTEEAVDLLEDIDETVHAWREEPGRKSYSEELVRTLHTLKGGARLADVMVLGDQAHNCETFVEHAERSGADYDADFFATLQRHVDGLTAAIDSLRKVGVVKAGAAAIEAEQGNNNSAKEDSLADSASNKHGVSPAGENKTGGAVEALANIVPLVGTTVTGPQASESVGAESTAPVVAESSRNTQEVVRVPSQLLENLVNLAGETSISRARAEEHVSEFGFSLEEMQVTVERLQEKLRRLDMETEAQILFRQEQVERRGLENFDPLEMDRYSQLQTLSRSLMESASDLLDLKGTMSNSARDMETLLLQQSRINTDLQEGLMQSRMVPFSRLVPRLRRIVRQVSNELGKTIEFELLNIEGEMDRSILERMLPPLEHMLRNAVDHGIEDADARRESGKSATGLISLGLMREGNEVVIILEDDGNGINVEKVRDKAIQTGLMKADADLPDTEILQFILETGLSTADKLTQISGRGVGLDVVNSEIKQLGGSIEIQSLKGLGSKFVVRLPFTVSVNRALTVSVGKDMYAIPLNSIEGIVRISPFELEAYYQPDSPRFEYAGQPYDLRYLGTMLGLEPAAKIGSMATPLPVVLVRSGDNAVAVQVDGVHGSREVVVKSLGPQFGMVHGVSGATVLGDGSVVVILDLLAIIRQQATGVWQSDIAIAARNEQSQALQDKRNLLVMVVDDSVTVRKVTSRFLEREGMDVVVARDGVEAIALLQDQMPDIMLLDIEMPRMDGFEVATEVRRSSRLKHLPIIMITSRTGAKHRERAFAIGVNNYLGKPYQERDLLQAIEDLVGAERLQVTPV